MHPIFRNNLFFLKDLSSNNNDYDIYASKDGQLLLECREQNVGIGKKILRNWIPHVPTIVGASDFRIYTPQGQQVLRLKLTGIYDEQDQLIGTVKEKVGRNNPKEVHDLQNQLAFSITVNFPQEGVIIYPFTTNETEIARVLKKDASVGSSWNTVKVAWGRGGYPDDATLEISASITPDHPTRKLILGMGIFLAIGANQRKMVAV